MSRRPRTAHSNKAKSRISSAQSTLDELPKGVSYVKGRNGTGYLIARKIGTPYKTEAGKMAVEVR